MPTKRRPPIDKVEATRQAIKNAKAVVSAAPYTAPQTLDAFIRFVEKTWLDKPVRPDQN